MSSTFSKAFAARHGVLRRHKCPLNYRGHNRRERLLRWTDPSTLTKRFLILGYLALVHLLAFAISALATESSSESEELCRLIWLPAGFDPDGVLTAPVNQILIHPRTGALWVATEQGASRLDGTEVFQDVMHGLPVYALEWTESGMLIGDVEGLRWVPDPPPESNVWPPALVNRPIRRVLIDREAENVARFLVAEGSRGAGAGRAQTVQGVVIDDDRLAEGYPSRNPEPEWQQPIDPQIIGPIVDMRRGGSGQIVLRDLDGHCLPLRHSGDAQDRSQGDEPNKPQRYPACL